MRLELPRPAEFQRGCIVGVATISGFVEVDAARRVTAVAPEGSPLSQAALASPWFIGPVGMFLADLRPLGTPIPCRGMLGFWPLPREVEQAIGAQLSDR